MPTKAQKPVPDGMNTVTTQLMFNGNCLQAIEFYKKALNATLVRDIAFGPDGKSVMHAMIRIGDTNLMLADAWPGTFATGPTGPVTAYLFVYVKDCDALYNQAVSAGCKVLNEMMDAFWGDRMGNVRDPYGHCWGIASQKWILTKEEVAKGQEEWMKSMSMPKVN
jgi:PhnB protein